jgi:hypothetical protein
MLGKAIPQAHTITPSCKCFGNTKGFARMSINAPKSVAMKGYFAPKLTIYGQFSALTASGSGVMMENNNGAGQPTRRP